MLLRLCRSAVCATVVIAVCVPYLGHLLDQFLVWVPVASVAAAAERSGNARPAVLFVGSGVGSERRHLHTWDQWIEEGFEIDVRALDEISSLEDLEPFNVVVVIQFPTFTASGVVQPEQERFEAAIDEYLQAGGGVMTLWSGGRWQADSPPLNHFLSQYGAAVTHPEEQVTDPEHSLGWIGRYRGCYTTQIAEAPMTGGIDVIGYVGQISSNIRLTLPLIIEDASAWTPVVRGEESAYSAEVRIEDGHWAGLQDEPGTYATEPLLAAYREVGAGRLFAFPQNVAFTVTSPEVFGNALWSNPLTTPDGWPVQNRELIMQTLRWLAEPTLDGSRFGGYRTPRDFGYDQDAILEKPERAIDWSSVRSVADLPDARFAGAQRGIVGAQSTFSGGEYTVAELADAARNAGLDFLVFTDRLDRMDAEAWAQLQAACRDQSSESFTALPGFIAEDRVGNTWFAVGESDFPTPPAVTEDGNRVNSTYHMRAQVYRKRMFGFANVMSNPNPWFQMRHGEMMAVYTDGPDGATDDGEEPYLKTATNVNNYMPVRITLVDSPETIADAARGMINIFAGPDPAAIENYSQGTGDFTANLRHQNPHPWYLSAGPRIDYHGGHNLGNLGTDEEKQNLYRYGFGLTGLEPGDRVQLMDGPTVFREWRADGEAFNTEHTWPHDQSRFFILRVLRDGETVLLSAPISVHIGRRFNMVGDRQNTLPYNYQPDEQGNYFVSGIPLGARYKGWAPSTLVYGNFKVWLSGAVGVEYQPRMFASFDTVPAIPFADEAYDLQQGRNIASYQYHRLSCPGVVIVDEHAHRYYPGGSRPPDSAPHKYTEPIELYQFDQRRYGLYGMLSQRNAQYVESEITVLDDITLEGDDPTVRVARYPFRFEEPTNLHMETRLGDDIERYRLNEVPHRRNLPFNAGDYAGIYPYGLPEGGAHYAVNGDLTLQLNHNANNVASIARLRVPKQWQAGDRFNYAMLFSTGASAPHQDRSDYQGIADFLGLRDAQFPAITELEGGELLDEPVIATIRTDPDQTVKLATAHDAHAPIGLTIRVRGLEPSWQVAYVLNGSSTWRYCGELEGDFYFNLYTNQQAHTVRLGHPVTADNTDVRIRLNDPSGKQSVFEVYNPTDESMMVTLRTNPEFLPEQEESVTVAPYTSQHVRFGRP